LFVLGEEDGAEDASALGAQDLEGEGGGREGGREGRGEIERVLNKEGGGSSLWLFN